MPGAQYALNIVHPGSPVLRIRYRSGILVDPYGFPDWSLVARAVVEMPPPPSGLTGDEIRVLDVLAANLALASVGEDPLWTDPVYGDAVATPPGWCWAHLGRSRRLALVPVELHGSYRHAGGMRTLDAPDPSRGLRGPFSTEPVRADPDDEVPEDVLRSAEEMLGAALPATYRDFLAGTNGAAPAVPAVLEGHGFVVDQPLFGLARADQHQDLTYAAGWLVDRFTPDLLPIGYVQGGLLAVELTGPGADTVWYWDDDDPRDEARFDPVHIREHLLYRCADSFAAFWASLRRPPAPLVERAADLVARGAVRPLRDELAGAGLPAAKRAPGQAVPQGRSDVVSKIFDVP